MEHLVASELKMTCAAVRAQMSGSEMMRWMQFMDWRARKQSGEVDPVEMDPASLAKAFGAD